MLRPQGEPGVHRRNSDSRVVPSLQFPCRLPTDRVTVTETVVTGTAHEVDDALQDEPHPDHPAAANGDEDEQGGV
jgi:hypothetical protein